MISFILRYKIASNVIIIVMTITSIGYLVYVDEKSMLLRYFSLAYRFKV